MPSGSWLMYTWVDFKSDFVSPQNEGKRPSSPSEENNGKCWHRVHVASSPPARAGDFFCFPGYRALSPSSSPLSLSCSKGWKAQGWGEWEKQTEVLGWRRCTKVETILWSQRKLISEHSSASFQLSPPLWVSASSSIKWGCQYFFHGDPTMCVIALIQHLSNICAWPILCCTVPVTVMNKMWAFHTPAPPKSRLLMHIFITHCDGRRRGFTGRRGTWSRNGTSGKASWRRHI